MEDDDVINLILFLLKKAKHLKKMFCFFCYTIILEILLVNSTGSSTGNPSINNA